MKNKQQRKHLIQKFYSSQEVNLIPLKGDGSDRKIFRISSIRQPEKTAILVDFDKTEENIDYTQFTQFFLNQSIPVPKVHSICTENTCYILEDLGEKNLAEYVDHWRKEKKHDLVLRTYKQVIDLLVKFQNLPLGWLKEHYSSRKMDRFLFEKDLDYFEREFVNRFKLTQYFTDDLRLELATLLNLVSNNDFRDVLVHRDFQNRNMMLYKDQIYLIDYQSAMSGSPFYDLACFLYSSRAMLNDEERLILLKHYWQQSSIKISFEKFRVQVDYFILIRRIRSLGSYAYLALEKGKTDFLHYFPKSFKELEALFKKRKHLDRFPYLQIFLTMASNTIQP